MPKLLTTETASARFRTILVSSTQRRLGAVPFGSSTPSAGVAQKLPAPCPSIGPAEKMQHCTSPRQSAAHTVQSFPIV
jgi:hypothetical protein